MSTITKKDIEKIVEGALDKQRREIFRYIETWTGLDAKNPDTGYEIRKAFEFARSAQKTSDMAIKKVMLLGMICGLLYGLFSVFSSTNIFKFLK